MHRQKSYFVYILASLSGTLYIGITNSLHKRVWQDKQHEVEGFTKEYEVDRLVYYETFYDVRNAIAREKQLKGWRREKKIALIESMNPGWKDLAKDWYGSRGPSTRAPKPGGLAQDDSRQAFVQRNEMKAGLAQDDSRKESCERRGPSTRVSRARSPQYAKIGRAGDPDNAREPSLARDDRRNDSVQMERFVTKLK